MLDHAPASPILDPPVAGADVLILGFVDDSTAAGVYSLISELSGHQDGPVRRATVKITRAARGVAERPLLVQANLDVNGRRVRVQFAAGSPDEVTRQLADRLPGQLARLARHRSGRYWPAGPAGDASGVPAPGPRPLHRPRPPGQPQVVRHKPYRLDLVDADRAAFDMDLLDYDVHLFAEEASGLDSVVYRGGPTSYRLAQVSPGPARIRLGTVPLTVSPAPAPVLAAGAALARLEMDGLPFLFYVDAADRAGRGRLLYRRYDGHYGLVVATGLPDRPPADPPALDQVLSQAGTGPQWTVAAPDARRAVAATPS